MSFRAAFQFVRDRFPLTAAGVIVVAASAWTLWRDGVGHQDLILGLIGSVGLVAVGVALPAVVGMALWLRYGASPPGRPLQLEDSVPILSSFRAPDPWWLAFVDVSWSWVAPLASVDVTSGSGSRLERVRPLRRGEFTSVVRRFEVADLLGLCRVRFEREETRGCTISPSTGRLENVDAVAGMRGGDGLSHPEGTPDGDPLDLRAYAQGDSIRMVLWKVYARSRTLVVRTPERALSPYDETRAYLVIGEGDDAAAGAVRVAARHASLGARWMLSVDGLAGEARDVAAAERLLVLSGTVRVDGGALGLGAFLRSAAGAPGQRAMVFVPSRPGPWLARARDAMAGSPVPVDVLVCADGVRRAVGETRAWWRESVRTGPPAEPTREELIEVLKVLTPASARVVVVDRTAGKVWPASAIDRMRASA